ncbi:DEAD/DEAH box helicase [Candidatus Eisenbacteria bacterium]|uniref:DEAD/DEAH box helicase n=1 Tax=Eiseniibacteriota bacterium TaxID=2212470 RepID=A0ABV6YN75_UNCEI
MNPRHENFYGLGIAPKLLEKIASLGYSKPTPIQHKAIPFAIDGKDIVGIAQTGTGKTLAYGVPMIQRLNQKKGKGLVLAPTRELAIQINAHLKPFTQALRMGTAVVIGGERMGKQVAALKRDPRIIVATPGRLIDLMEQRIVRLNDVNVLVLDEADRMLDMGFAPQIEKIIRTVPKDRQTMLFSATMPTAIMRMASSHMQLPVRTEIAPSGTAAEGVSHEVFVVEKKLKGSLLEKLLQQYRGSVLVFTRTKRGAERVRRSLKKAGFAAAEIHSDRTLPQRREALTGFKTGKYRVLVATDIAARGIDVEGIELVVNYDLPDEPGSYVHRIGRTGRAGMEGIAVSFATPDQGSDVRNIEKLIKISLSLSEHPEIPAKQFLTGELTSFQKRLSRHKRGMSRRPVRKRR